MATQLNGLFNANHIDDIIIREVGVKLITLDTDIHSIYCENQIKYSEINLPILTGITSDIYLFKNDGLQSLYLSQLPAYNSISVIQNDALTGITHSNNLKTINGAIVIEDNSLLESFNCRFVTGDTFSIKITGNDAMIDANFVSLQSCGNINISNNSVLENIFFSSALNSTSINCSNNALTEGTVDGILFSIDSAGYTGGTLNLSGGTNSAPSNPDGLSYKTSLEGKGWTVATN